MFIIQINLKSFIGIINSTFSIALQKTLGVPCAEKYPLNLMQLVLPKGKVEQPPKIVFIP
jgi:hypothetical protein